MQSKRYRAALPDITTTSMADKKRYYKLDDIGIIGSQEKKDAARSGYHQKKDRRSLSQVKSYC